MKNPVNQSEKNGPKSGKTASMTGRKDSQSRKMDDGLKNNQSTKSGSTSGKDSRKNGN